MRLAEKKAESWQEAAGVIVTAFKPTLKTQASKIELVLRLVKTSQQPGQFRVLCAFDFDWVQEINLLEEPAGPLIEFNKPSNFFVIEQMQAGEIKTFLLGVILDPQVS